MKDKKKGKYNLENEKVKYNYRLHLRGISQKEETTINASLKHIRDFEIYTSFAGFDRFNKGVAGKYIQHIFDEGLSLSYISDNTRIIRDFLKWVERQRGYRSKINYNDIDYLNITRNQRRTAKSSEYKKSYKFEKIIQVARNMPEGTSKEKRDKAIISMQAMCCLRISELRTIKLRNLIEEDGCYFLHVSPKSMSVKFAKTRQVVFLDLGKDIQENVLSWYNYLRSLGFKDSDPLFPMMGNTFVQENLLEPNIKRQEIKSATTIRGIFKKAFEDAGLEYIDPHSFRKTLARYAETQSPAFLNAVRQNLGHSSIDTTLSSYGQLSIAEQRKIISNNRFDKVQ